MVLIFVPSDCYSGLLQASDLSSLPDGRSTACPIRMSLCIFLIYNIYYLCCFCIDFYDLSAWCGCWFVVYIRREKGRDLTLSYDKSPYTSRNVKRAKWRHKKATKKSDNQWLAPVIVRRRVHYIKIKVVIYSHLHAPLYFRSKYRRIFWIQIPVFLNIYYVERT